MTLEYSLEDTDACGNSWSSKLLFQLAAANARIAELESELQKRKDANVSAFSLRSANESLYARIADLEHERILDEKDLAKKAKALDAANARADAANARAALNFAAHLESSTERDAANARATAAEFHERTAEQALADESRRADENRGWAERVEALLVAAEAKVTRLATEKVGLLAELGGTNSRGRAAAAGNEPRTDLNNHTAREMCVLPEMSDMVPRSLLDAANARIAEISEECDAYQMQRDAAEARIAELEAQLNDASSSGIGWREGMVRAAMRVAGLEKLCRRVQALLFEGERSGRGMAHTAVQLLLIDAGFTRDSKGDEAIGHISDRWSGK